MANVLESFRWYWVPTDSFLIRSERAFANLQTNSSEDIDSSLTIPHRALETLGKCDFILLLLFKE
jgi:hypothetical protein